MKRRFLSILLAGCLAASLTACGGTKEESAAPAESSDSASGEPILLGTISPNTGNLAAYGTAIMDVADDGIIIERGDGIEAVNLEYVTRIREWPRKANGKKKAIFD